NQRSIVEFNRGRYVTFNIGSYSRKDLVQLKNRLVSELEKIQNLSNRIESGDLQLRSGGDRTANKQQRPNNKKIAGNKRPPPFDSGRGPKRSAAENASLMKLCGQTFDEADEAQAQPMDLGTVKSKIAKNLYDSPLDFAADVRLTFDNALLYNPKGHDVHVMAEQLLARFEDLFKPVYNKLEEDERDQERIIVGGGRGGVSAIAGTSGGEELQGSSWNHIPTPERLKKPSPKPVAKNLRECRYLYPPLGLKPTFGSVGANAIAYASPTSEAIGHKAEQWEATEAQGQGS
ncbi:Transcription factor GTE7, partial [Vitis vinifera]